MVGGRGEEGGKRVREGALLETRNEVVGEVCIVYLGANVETIGSASIRERAWVCQGAGGG